MGIFDLFRSKPAPQPTKPAGRTLPALKSLARAMFQSGEVNRLTGDWGTNPVPAEWIIYRYQRTLVARSREQAQNNDYMKAYLRLCRTNIVGAPGVLLQSQATNKDDRAAIEAAFRDWGRRQNCDVAGKLSWRAMQAAAVDTAARDGEFMFKIVTGSEGGKYGFALQVLDPQRCPVDLDQFDLPNGEFVRSGIRYNRHGKPLAYAFAEQTPDRSQLGYSYAGKSYTWISADEIIHGFVSEMAGQKRGLPWLATGLFRMKQMGATEDAAIVNARVSAAKMGFLEPDKESDGPEYEDFDEADLEIDAEAGAFPLLPRGWKLNKFDPQYPSGEFAVAMKHFARAMAAGGGVSYHSLTGDLENVNFSSIRQGVLDEREFFKDRQEWLTEELCDVVFEAWLQRALLGGKIMGANGRPLPATKVDDLAKRLWQPRRWSWIDPRADVDAATSSKNNLLSSPGQLIREQGRDPETVWAEIGADIKAMRAAGIDDEFIKLAMGMKLAPPQKDEPTKEN